MKWVGRFSLLLGCCLLLGSGCRSLKPIQSELTFELHEIPTLRYTSEKDVIYFRIREDPQTGEKETAVFMALASAAAFAQAQRDQLVEQTNAAQAEAVSETVDELLPLLRRLAVSPVFLTPNPE